MEPETHHLNYGFTTMGCPDRDLDSILDLAKRFGLINLELRAVGGCLDLPSEFALHREGRSMGIQMLRNSGISIPVLASGLSLSSGNFLTSVIAWAELAESLEAPWIRVFGNASGPDVLEEKLWKVILANMDGWQKLRSNRGLSVELLIETHDIFSSTTSCLEFFQRLGRGSPLLWDIQHTCGTCLEAPSETWHAMGPWVRHVHVSDRNAFGKKYQPVLPGEGVLPIHDMLNLLLKSDYSGIVSLEWEKLWHPELPEIEAALQAATKCWFSAPFQSVSQSS